MAKSNRRRKTVIFSVIVLVLIVLGGLAMFRKHDVVVTVQTEKVGRHTLTEIVVANGKIQPVVQVKISPEVSGEIIALPVKEGQYVHKGDLLVKIKPDFYTAARGQADANYKASLASQATSEATLRKAEAEFRRNSDLFAHQLISTSAFDEAKANNDVAAAQLSNSVHQVEMARASLDSAEDQLSKTTIVSPLEGTVTKLNSQLGERVLGTVQNVGTEIMTISDLNEMEARVDLGEIDVVLIAPGQNVRLEVDAFKDRKFTGTVTEIANSSSGSGLTSGSGGSSTQDATKFGVKIRIKEKESFRPGMSCTAEIETRYRTNVLAVPIASVTTRVPKDKSKPGELKGGAATNGTAHAAAVTNAPEPAGTNVARGDKKGKETAKPVEVVFLLEGDHVKMAPVKIGISDESFWEIVDGLQEGQEVISGGYRAISRDLEDGKKVKKGIEEVKGENKKPE